MHYQIAYIQSNKMCFLEGKLAILEFPPKIWKDRHISGTYRNTIPNETDPMYGFLDGWMDSFEDSTSVHIEVE